MPTVKRKTLWPVGLQLPLIPHEPAVPVASLIICSDCGRRIAAARLHFLVGTRAVICGACVPPRIDRVKTYGRRSDILDHLQAKRKTPA